MNTEQYVRYKISLNGFTIIFDERFTLLSQH